MRVPWTQYIAPTYLYLGRRQASARQLNKSMYKEAPEHHAARVRKCFQTNRIGEGTLLVTQSLVLLLLI